MIKGWLVGRREKERGAMVAWVGERKVERQMPRDVGMVGLILLWWILCGAWMVGMKITSGFFCSFGSPWRISRTFCSSEDLVPRVA